MVKKSTVKNGKFTKMFTGKFFHPNSIASTFT